MLNGATLQLQTSAGHLVCTAVSAVHPHEQDEARRAIAVVDALPRSAPRPEKLWSFDEDFGVFGRWTVAGWSLLDVRPVGPDWTQDEVAGTLRILRRIGEIEVPSGEPYLEDATTFGPEPWYRLAEKRPDSLRLFSAWLEPRLEALAEIAVHATEAAAGPYLTHGSPGRHSLLLPTTPEGEGIAVGWFRASRGAPFVDTLQLLAHIRAEGGPAPEVVLARHPLPARTDPDAVTCLVTALAGQYVEEALRAELTGEGPASRDQQALARVCVEWLRRRLGF